MDVSQRGNGRSSERPRAKEQFTAVPFRVDRALEAEELTFGQAVLVKRLIYRCRRDEGETFFKLAELKGEMRWPWSIEQLRQDLHAISPVWFDVTAPDPPKKTWRVCPTGALLQMDGASALESTDNRWSSEQGPTPHDEKASDPSDTPTLGVAPALEENRAEEEVDEDSDQTGLRDESQELQKPAGDALEDLLQRRDPKFDESSARTIRRLLKQAPPHTAQYARDELEAAVCVRKPTAFVVRIVQRRIEASRVELPKAGESELGDQVREAINRVQLRDVG